MPGPSQKIPKTLAFFPFLEEIFLQGLILVGAWTAFKKVQNLGMVIHCDKEEKKIQL